MHIRLQAVGAIMLPILKQYGKCVLIAHIISLKKTNLEAFLYTHSLVLNVPRKKVTVHL